MYYVTSKTDETFGYGKDVTITPLRGGFIRYKYRISKQCIASKMAKFWK